MNSTTGMPPSYEPAGQAATHAVPGQDPWQTTRVSKTLWPPQAGTKRLRERYGAALVCVRYRHDAEGRHRYTTVELLVDHGPVRTPRGGKRTYELPMSDSTRHLHDLLLNAGAAMDKTNRVWRLSLSMAKILRVEKLIRRSDAGRKRAG